ncbi:MAG: aspartate-semialdehyde dehydrogenase [Spirochaetia bacterium]|nr:aspartate-semialdehyde dehydrogenase [Spirochaetia bacterium]
MSEKSIAIVGATGAVGLEFISVLEKLNLPIKNLKLLASKRSAGKTLKFKQTGIPVEETTRESFKNVDIALFSAGSSISRLYAEDVKNSGCVMIDNSSAFRMDADVPLVIPEINPQDALKHNGIIANPNCSTIIMLMAVYPIHKKYPVKRIVLSTYQAASGAGWEAMEELRKASIAYLNDQPFQQTIMPHPYAFNLFSHNSKMLENGYNEEEMKTFKESRKILHDDNISITATCVRVPIFRAHSEAVNMEFHNEAPSVEECKTLLDEFPGIKVIDDRKNNHFPMPNEASGNYDCLVGRIRKDESLPSKAINLFVCGDQLLKGAALNAVQIAKLLV